MYDLPKYKYEGYEKTIPNNYTKTINKGNSVLYV